jgi:hypothetical protein
MLRIYQLQRLTAAFVATVLCAGLPVQRGAAQTPPVDCKSIAPKNGTSCNQTITITKPVTATDGTTVPQTTTIQQSSTTTTSYGTTTWQGLNWGIGIAADFDLGGKRVTGATIDTVPGGSIVRVTDTSGNVGVSFVLEAHYFVKEWLPQPQCIDFNCNEYAIGPFVAIEVGGGATATPTTGPITGYALGVMVGLHHPTTDPKLANSSWNFGVELRVDPSATVFSDGVRANQPPPSGITTADQLLEKEPRYGLMLLSSFSF